MDQNKEPVSSSKSHPSSFKIKSASFYSSKKYVTPLERESTKLKEIHSKYAPLGPKKISSINSTPKSTQKAKHVRMKRKTSPKDSKHNSKKLNSVQNKKTKSPSHVAGNVEPPPVNLEGNKNIASKKFFKTRSPGHAKETVALSIIPKNILDINAKAASSFKHHTKTVSNGSLKSEKKKSVQNMPKRSLLENSVASDFFLSENSSPNVLPSKNCNVGMLPSEAFIDEASALGNPDDAPGMSFADDIVASHDSCKAQDSNDETQKLFPIFYDNKEPDKSYEERHSSNSSANKKSKLVAHQRKSNDGLEQLMIDAGQKELGAKQCPTCNMIYHIANDEDELLHANFHQMFLTNLMFPGWKTEYEVGHWHDGRIVKITNDSEKYKIKKVENVLKIVDRDLGFPNMGFPKKPNATFLLFVSPKKKIIGCLVAEAIQFASQVELDVSTSNSSGLWCSGSKVIKAICGINRIWVSPGNRRQKIATRMMDCIRSRFLDGYHYLSLNEIAFSDPSLNGRDFAAAYMKTDNFLVYC